MYLNENWMDLEKNILYTIEHVVCGRDDNGSKGKPGTVRKA